MEGQLSAWVVADNIIERGRLGTYDRRRSIRPLHTFRLMSVGFCKSRFVCTWEGVQLVRSFSGHKFKKPSPDWKG